MNHRERQVAERIATGLLELCLLLEIEPVPSRRQLVQRITRDLRGKDEAFVEQLTEGFDRMAKDLRTNPGLRGDLWAERSQVLRWLLDGYRERLAKRRAAARTN